MAMAGINSGCDSVSGNGDKFVGPRTGSAAQSEIENRTEGSRKLPVNIHQSSKGDIKVGGGMTASERSSIAKQEDAY